PRCEGGDSRGNYGFPRARRRIGNVNAYSQNGRRRVVVTGLGAVTPLGNDVETTWSNLVAGESGAGPITQFDPSEYAVNFACELKDFDPTQWIDRKQAR